MLLSIDQVQCLNITESTVSVLLVVSGAGGTSVVLPLVSRPPVAQAGWVGLGPRQTQPPATKPIQAKSMHQAPGPRPSKPSQLPSLAHQA